MITEFEAAIGRRLGLAHMEAVRDFWAENYWKDVENLVSRLAAASEVVEAAKNLNIEMTGDTYCEHRYADKLNALHDALSDYAAPTSRTGAP